MRTRDGDDHAPLEERKQQFEALDEDGTGLVSLAEFTKSAVPPKSSNERINTAVR